MRNPLGSLTKQQKQTLACLLGAVAALALAGFLVYDLNAKRLEVMSLTQEVEAKEQNALNGREPSAEELEDWSQRESRISNTLLSDQMVPQLFEEISRLANENHLQRLALNTEEAVIDPEKQGSTLDMELAALGVRRYLVITIKFLGDYPDIARFLGDVVKLQRPLEYRVADMRRAAPWIDVTLVMNVYKREGA